MFRDHVSALIHQRSWKFGSEGQAGHVVETGLAMPKDSSSRDYSLRVR